MMKTSKTCLAVTLVVVSGVLVAADTLHIPDTLKPHLCRRIDPSLSACVNRSIENLRPLFVKGIPEMNLGPMEPFQFPEISLTIDPRNVGVQGHNDVTAIAKDIRCFGGTNFILQNLKIDLEKMDFQAKVQFPQIVCNADYKIDVRVAKLPIKGFGPISGNITNAQTEVKIHGTVIEKDGVRHLSFETVSVNIVKLDNLDIHLKNKYKGETLLTDAFITLINSRSKIFVQTFIPLLELAAADILKKVSNETNEKLDFDEIFPA